MLFEMKIIFLVNLNEYKLVLVYSLHHLGEEVVTLKPGEKRVFIEIKILPDDLPETDEILVVRIDR